MTENRTSQIVEAVRSIIVDGDKKVLDLSRLVGNFPAIAEKYKRMEETLQILAMRNQAKDAIPVSVQDIADAALAFDPLAS